MKTFYYFLLPLVIIMTACQKDSENIIKSPSSDHSYRVPLVWNQMYLEVERFTPGYKPPVSARNVAYINLIGYESIVHGSEFRYKSFSGYYEGLDIDEPDDDLTYNWEICLHEAYDKAFELFFPVAPAEQQFKILEISNSLRSKLEFNIDPDVYQRSAQYGQYVAETVYAWSMEDHWGHEAYLKNTDPQYFPPVAEGLWKPTYPDFLPALLPHWGKVRTFGAKKDLEILPPPTFSTDPNSSLYKEALETRTIVDEIKKGERAEDHWIAQFWSDDCPILTFSPAGRWISITNQLMGIEKLDLMESVVVYAKVSMALADAGIHCWRGKYEHNCLRPIDYIRDYMGDQQWNTVMCPDGSGGFYTPPFPTYPSGHATFGGAAAFVLEDIFGASYRFTDRSHETRTEFRGAPRTFGSFREMAIENGYSRIPLGVHFQSDSDAGIALGLDVGTGIRELPWQY